MGEEMTFKDACDFLGGAYVDQHAVERDEQVVRAEEFELCVLNEPNGFGQEGTVPPDVAEDRLDSRVSVTGKAWMEKTSTGEVFLRSSLNHPDATAETHIEDPNIRKVKSDIGDKTFVTGVEVHGDDSKIEFDTY